MSEQKKLVIEIILFLVVLIGVSILYNYIVSPKNSGRVENFEEVKEEGKVEILEITGKEQFEKEVTSASKTVFVDFYATWCMPCKAMEPILEEVSKECPEVKLVRVDIDQNEELAIEYNVMSIPTMLVMKNGEENKRFVGVTQKEEIVKVLLDFE